jgi:hypothetical protein
MSPETTPGSNLNPGSSPSTLANRVKARVAEAEQLLDTRARDAKGKQKHLRPTSLKGPAASLTDSSGVEREVRSLRMVYCEMRAIYRSYRRKTGETAVPELRSAVLAFNRGQSLTSLVHIATFLDDRKLLAW